MKKSKENKKAHRYDKGQIFVKVMAGVLALLMLVVTGASVIYSLIG